jgi:hypothetical protein
MVLARSHKASGKPMKAMRISRRNLLLAVLVILIGAWAAELHFWGSGISPYSQFVVYTQSGAPNFVLHTEPSDANYSLIEEGLYQGGYVAEPPPGTVAVLNLCEQKDKYQCEIHRHEPIPDAAPAPSLNWLRERVQFVDQQRRAGRVIYVHVHCFGGVSRAGMVVTAYEMHKNHWTRDEALTYVRARRSITNPNPAFMQLLKEWEQELKVRRPNPPDRDALQQDEP